MQKYIPIIKKNTVTECVEISVQIPAFRKIPAIGVFYFIKDEYTLICVTKTMGITRYSCLDFAFGTNTEDCAPEEYYEAFAQEHKSLQEDVAITYHALKLDASFNDFDDAQMMELQHEINN